MLKQFLCVVTILSVFLQSRADELALSESTPESSGFWVYACLFWMGVAGFACFKLLKGRTKTSQDTELIKHLTERLEVIPKASHNFVVDMIVELRRPLNGIIGMLQMIDPKKYLPSDREYLDLIQFCSQHMIDLLERIQYYSENQAGVAIIKQKAVKIRDVLKELAGRYIQTIKDKGVEFSLVVDEDVPVTVQVDPLVLKIIVTNLLDNAVKFTNQGSIRIKVEKDKNSSGKILFSVKDSGIGISSKTQQEIFDAFSATKSSIPWYDRGTGLGLSLVKNLVKKMNGEVWLDSEVGQGSTFYFNIEPSGTMSSGTEILSTKESPPSILDEAQDPLIASSTTAGRKPFPVAASEPVPQKAWEEEPIQSTSANARILIVDDEYVARKVLSSLLDRMGFEHDVAVNGEDALAKVSKKAYRLIFMDIQMPLIDGWEASKKILASSADFKPKIVALTSHARMKDRQMSESVGMDAFLTKPIRLHELRKVLDQFASDLKKLTQAPVEKTVEGAANIIPFRTKEETDADAANEPLVDLVVLKEYYENDLEVCMEIVRKTVQSLFAMVDRLEKAVASGSKEKIMASTHEIRGAVNLIRCRKGLAIIDKIDEICERHHDVEPFRVMMESLAQDLLKITENIDETVKNNELVAYG